MVWKPIFVFQGKVFVKINPEQIVCLSTEENYTKIFLPDKTFYIVRTSLAGTLKKLPSDLFIKIHRAIAVSILYIETIDKDHLIVCNEPVPIGKRYYKSVIDQLNIIK